MRISALLLILLFISCPVFATEIDVEKKRIIQAHFLIKMGAFIKWDKAESLPLVLCINTNSDKELARTLSKLVRKKVQRKPGVTVRAFEFNPENRGESFKNCNIIYNFSLSSLLETGAHYEEPQQYLHKSQSVWITSSAQRLQEGAHFALVEMKGKIRLLGNKVLLQKPSLHISTQLMQIVKFESEQIQNR